jgi:hypothetical protein
LKDAMGRTDIATPIHLPCKNSAPCRIPFCRLHNGRSFLQRLAAAPAELGELISGLADR